MSGRIVRKPQAQADLIDYFVYIAEDNLEAGERFLAAAEQAMQRLVEMPGMGRLRDDIDDSKLMGLRSWRIHGFENYLIFYRPVDAGIEVIRVIHGARDLVSILGEE